MENVPKALPYLKDEYSFLDLGLASWAKRHGIKPKSIAISIADKYKIVDSSTFGAPQKRKRLFIIEFDDAPIEVTSQEEPELTTLGKILRSLPEPLVKSRRGNVSDPNYPDLVITKKKLTDHYYDTGIPYRVWKESEYLKTNHPYMGRMSFPEKLDAPARTVVASPFSRSREAMIFRCASGRAENGEYRAPTVREAATLMTFPISYQFFGTEAQKWKLVGNAVCPMTARVIGRCINNASGMRSQEPRSFRDVNISDDFINLNGRSHDRLSITPTRKKGARFRRHTIKTGNMTVALSNYDMSGSEQGSLNWGVYATYGISTQHKVQKMDISLLRSIEDILEVELDAVEKRVIKEIDDLVEKAVPANRFDFQKKYEAGSDFKERSNPVTFIEELRSKIEQNVNGAVVGEAEKVGFSKKDVPLKQVVAAYALLKAVRKVNKVRG